ncbi:MAG: alpha-ketoglutarate-dependent dioxygenase AlkB [Arenimonas sp.]
MLEEIPLPGASLQLDRHWLPAAQADALFDSLRSTIDWEVHRIRLFGRMVDSPRMSSWIGDADASYVYSGVCFQPRPWPPALLPVRDRLGAIAGVRFNSVLANLYRDGRDAMGWHSDDERELGPQPVIASISLGASRRFILKHRRQPEGKLVLELPHGSLLLMRGDTQRNYRHALPRTRTVPGARINLTFRQVLAPRA